MLRETEWQPSRFIQDKEGNLHVNPDKKFVLPASRLIVQLVAEKYQEYIPKYVTGKLVDLGAGEAPLYGLYKNHAKEITCVDWPNSYYQASYIDVKSDLSRPLPFENEIFDTILLVDVLEHVFNPHSLWQEMSRILTPGGVILLNIPFFYWLHESPHDYYRYTRHALERMAHENGFQILICEEIDGLPGITIDFMSKILMHLKFPFHERIITAINSLSIALHKTKGWKYLKYMTMSKFPLGYFMVARKAKKPE